MDGSEFICPDGFVRHMCVRIIISGHLEADLIEKSDIKSGTIQEILINVNNKSTICLFLSGSPGYIYSGLVTTVALYI